MSKDGNKSTLGLKRTGVSSDKMLKNETLSSRRRHQQVQEKSDTHAMAITPKETITDADRLAEVDSVDNSSVEITKENDVVNSADGALIKNQINKKPDEKEVHPIKTLEEFLDRFLARKGKLLKDDKVGFELLEYRLNDEVTQRLSKQFHEQDKDLKYCLTLSEFLLEGSTESSGRKQLLSFIERVLSEYSYFAKIPSNTILQLWLDESRNDRDKLQFFENHFKNLKGEDNKFFTLKQLGTLLCISAVWLYFKKESDFTTLTRYLSSSAFSTEGRSSNLIEPQAFAFATSMISSNKKKGFAYFLQKVSETEAFLSGQLKIQTADSNQKSSKIFELNKKLKVLIDKGAALEAEKQELATKIIQLDSDVAGHQEKARHRHTHHEDSKDELRIKLKNVLEGELKDVLEKAKKAHAKGKHEVVEYQIDDALDILVRELERVKQNG